MLQSTMHEPSARRPGDTISPCVAPEAMDLWAQVEPALRAFKAIVREADRQALKQGAVPDTIAREVREAYARCNGGLNALLGNEAPVSETAKTTVGVRVQAELLPYLLLSDIAERSYAKPRGYAGDFLTIAHIYEDRERGVGRVGPLLDRCFLDVPAARAVKNRRALVAREIGATVAARAGAEARVCSLACGPAQEVFDAFAGLDDPSVLHATLVDMDPEALAFVGERRAERRLSGQMSLVQENLIHLVTHRSALEMPPQDLIYSIGLIDYFKDAFVVRLLDFAHAHLAPGGRVIVGNFHPQNPTRAFMEHVLEWKLIHRTNEEMNALFSASAFARPCTRIQFEDQGINLFAECRRD